MDQKTMPEMIKEVGDAVHELKGKLEKSQKDTDGLVTEQAKKLADFIGETQEKMQAVQAKADAAVKAADARASLATSGDPSIAKAARAASGLLGLNPMAKPWDVERKSNVRSYLRKGDETAKGELLSREAEELKEFNVVVDPNGGFMVPPEMANFMSTIEFETSPLRGLARTVTIGSDAIEIPLSDQRFQVQVVSERGTNANTNTPQFGMIRIPTYEYEARPRATQKMLDDSVFDIEQFIAQEVADEITRTENTHFFTGNGTTQPQGLLTLPAWTAAGVYQRNALEQINSGAASALTADGFIKLQGSLKEAYQARAAWLMKRSSFVAALLLKDGNGRYLIGNDLTSGNFIENPSILGKKVTFADDMPVVAASSLSVAYGDFQRGYLIVDRMGVRVLRDPYSAKPYVEFYTTKRTGGGVMNFDSMKLMKTSA